MGELSRSERTELEKCESIIEQGIQTFVNVGSALATIRDERLYRAKCKNFEQYCDERFGFSRRTAYHYIEASEVVHNCAQKIDASDMPKKESQLREVARAPEEKQPEVVQRANERAWAEGRDPTAKDFKEAVQELVDSEPELLDAEEDDEEIVATPASSYVEQALENAGIGKKLASAISQIKKQVNATEEAPGLEDLMHRRGSICRHLDNARNAIVTATPHSACPRCDGKGCEQCGRMGWINSILARELK